MDFANAAEDGNAVPAFLSMPDRLVAKVADRLFGKPLVGCLQLLKTDDIRLGQL
jgi:hypothetical protein